jgi:hypothetical protein
MTTVTRMYSVLSRVGRSLLRLARLLRSPAACLHGMRCVLHGVGCPVGRGGNAPCVWGLFVCLLFVCTPTTYSEYSQR